MGGLTFEELRFKFVKSPYFRRAFTIPVHVFAETILAMDLTGKCFASGEKKNELPQILLWSPLTSLTSTVVLLHFQLL